MRDIFVSKVVLSIGCGETGDRVEKSKKLLEKITGHTAVISNSKKRIPAWNVRPGIPIGSKVTIRGSKAVELLKNCFKAVEDKIRKHNFDDNGNFAFGIKNYIDLPTVKYDADLGIFGFDVCVTLARKGFRVSHRKINPSKIGSKHKIKKEDAVNFVKEHFGVTIS